MKDRGNGLAVIVPIGPGRTAAVALKSLLQAPDIRELVVVLDGGSVDPVVREFEARVPTRIVESRGQGAPAARNSGASVVGDCDILWFLDDDDAALPAAPERIQAAMVSMPHCGAWAFPGGSKIPGRRVRYRERALRGVRLGYPRSEKCSRWLLVGGDTPRVFPGGWRL